MKTLLILVLSLSMIGCMELKGEPGIPGTVGEDGIDGTAGPAGPQGPPATLPSLSPLEEDVNYLVDDENDYRLGLGQSVISSGLGCTLSTVTGGDRIQATIAGHNTLTGIVQVATYLFKGTFNQPDTSSSNGMNVIPSALRSLYTNLYLLRCQGQVVITESNYHSFELSSDDASVLYIDNTKIIDNDNGHGITTVSGQRYLRRGVHIFRLDYAQTGAGNQALILKMNDQTVNPLLWYH